MKLGSEALELDAIDLLILELLQDQGRIPLVKLGEQVGLSSPSVIDRVKKLEDSGIITGYHASVDARRLGKDVTAFIGVSIAHPKAVTAFEHTVALLDDVLECHHVTGEHTLLLKIKTDNTSSLERLISTIRSIEGVSRTETMVVLSTHTERATISVGAADDSDVTGNGHGNGHTRKHRHGTVKTVVADPKRV
jgi:Lrp/AsnC family transcriptional regulator, leucine-responsive regulatory protein